MDNAAIAVVAGEENVKRIADAFHDIIKCSFVVCPARMTHSAVKERFDICMRLLQKLRGDLHWSITKTLDHVAEYLVYELRGIAYRPNAKTTWSPGGLGRGRVLSNG